MVSLWLLCAKRVPKENSKVADINMITTATTGSVFRNVMNRYAKSFIILTSPICISYIINYVKRFVKCFGNYFQSIFKIPHFEGLVI